KYKFAPPGQHQLSLAHFHATDTGFGGGELDFGEEKQIVNRFRELPEAVAPVALNAVELIAGAGLGDLAVSFDPQSSVADVIGRNERRNAPFWIALIRLRAAPIVIISRGKSK